MSKRKTYPSKCHPDRIAHTSGLCGKCWYMENREKVLVQHKAYYRRNREKMIADTKRWRLAHPEKRKEYRKRYFAKRGGSPAYMTERHLQREYGITTQQYELIFDQQNGKCCICSIGLPLERIKGRGATVDHDHKTGFIRGILCQHCNKLLGHARDDPKILASAIHYLAVFKLRVAS